MAKRNKRYRIDLHLPYDEQTESVYCDSIDDCLEIVEDAPGGVKVWHGYVHPHTLVLWEVWDPAKDATHCSCERHLATWEVGSGESGLERVKYEGFDKPMAVEEIDSEKARYTANPSISPEIRRAVERAIVEGAEHDEDWW